MRKLCSTWKLALASLVACLAFPAAALAHYIDDAHSTADCAKATIAFVDFETTDKSYGIDITVKRDGTTIATRHVSPNEFPGSSLTVTVPYTASAGSHTITVYAKWRTSSDYYSRTVSGCTPPKPPTPPAPPVTPPTPPVPPVTPPTPTTPPNTPKKPKPHCMTAGKYSITVRPKNQMHGLVHFRLNGPNVRKVRWFVDHKRRGTHAYPDRAPYERTSGKGGRVYHVFLWAKPVWGDALYGYHRIKVRVKLTNGCTAVKRLKYFNNDPPRWGVTTKGALS